MTPFDEALAVVLGHVHPLGTETMTLGRMLGSFLAEPVVAPADIPLFDNSAMDGFGVHLADVAGATPQRPARLHLWAAIRAGDPAGEALPQGAAVRIFTGAPSPAGVEAVVMREDCEEAAGEVRVKRAMRPGENIRHRGGEFRQGDRALPAGIRANPAVIGLLATFGYAEWPVYRKPAVALVATGSELVPPGRPLPPGGVYDANTPVLAAALEAMGIDRVTQARAPDDPAALKEAIARALADADAVISLGGVSVGDCDYVKEVCADLGVHRHLWRVAMKPGKPFYFGTLPAAASQKLVFGLPGNPVSALVTFHELVKPALLRMMGAADVSRPLLPATLLSGLHKAAGRMEFVRGVAAVQEGRLAVRPTTGQESHMLGGLAAADCLIRFPQDAERLEPGDPVEIELLRWD